MGGYKTALKEPQLARSQYLSCVRVCMCMSAIVYTGIFIHSLTQTGAPDPSPVTLVGVFLSLVSPVPSCPSSFQPQQSTPPPVSSAHVWRYPAAMATAPAERRRTGHPGVGKILRPSRHVCVMMVLWTHNAVDTITSNCRSSFNSVLPRSSQYNTLAQTHTHTITSNGSPDHLPSAPPPQSACLSRSCRPSPAAQGRFRPSS